jgi:hypothetical protein
MRALAARAGVSIGVVHAIEAGVGASLESYARVATALSTAPVLRIERHRSREVVRGTHADGEDFVHAAMGECEARALRRPTSVIGIDEPYQHFQFAGRADVLVREGPDLLHIENRTRFPNVQETAGAYNAKRRYLAGALADLWGVGTRGWRSVTHVMACLWTSEVLHVLRLRSATFDALCPDAPDALNDWLNGTHPKPGVTSTLVLLDPAVPFGSRRRTIAPSDDVPKVEPRYRGYAEAADALRRLSGARG